ncbi:MAG: choice-of-anchor Q domain-containing protein [Dokdonella sp.]|uniref:choice-of-anchor Q domain-containing protein n=1 Tax=Dokdonella sp. TaxID=2291710 RepID=UPI00326640E1
MLSVTRDSNARALARNPLAAGLAAIVLAGVVPLGASAADTSWIRLRTDPARRIFPQLMVARTPPSIVAAPTLLVGNCEDDGPGSLRETIRNAVDGSMVDLRQLACSTITLTTGAIEIPVDSLTLTGKGRSLQVIDGNHADRVFLHPRGGALTFQSLSIRNGRNRETGFDVAGGGCVASAGYMTLDHAEVSGCYAGGEGAYGGGIYAYSLTMLDSTLSGNVAKGVHPAAGTAAFGGGAFVYSMALNASTVTGNRAVHDVNPGRSSYDIGGALVTVVGGPIIDSTIDSNYSQERGGGVAAFNPVSVANSTISGNVAANGIGGGFLMRWPSTIELNSATVAGNHANGGGGGVWIGIAGSLMNSSIVAGNTSSADTFANLETNAPAIVFAGDHNLVGHSNPGIVLPDDTIKADPRLAPLASNGGPTRTRALLPGSAAIDAGTNPAGGPFDQRGSGYQRVQGAAADIGAFELQPAADAGDVRAVPAFSLLASALLAMLLGSLAMVRTRVSVPFASHTRRQR